jgi:hypothetical protein
MAFSGRGIAKGLQHPCHAHRSGEVAAWHRNGFRAQLNGAAGAGA